MASTQTFSVLDDAELMRRVGMQDREAFLAMYDRFSPRMLGLIESVLRDRHASEDVLQRVMLEVWQRHAARYQPVLGPVDTWLLRLAKSRAIDEVRSSQRKRFVANDGVEAATDQRETHTDELPMDHAHVRRLLEALRDLSEEERVPIELAYAKGMSRDQIALHCGVPVGTIKTRIRRGLASLQVKLADMGGDEPASGDRVLGAFGGAI